MFNIKKLAISLNSQISSDIKTNHKLVCPNFTLLFS